MGLHALTLIHFGEQNEAAISRIFQRFGSKVRRSRGHRESSAWCWVCPAA